MSTNLEKLVNNAKEAVDASGTGKRKMKTVERKIKINGISSRKNIKRVSEDNGIPMNDVYVRINFCIEGQDADLTYTASQRLSSIGKQYLDLEAEALKPMDEKKVYTVSLAAYEDDPDNAFITFLPEISEDEFLNALKPASNKKQGKTSELFS